MPIEATKRATKPKTLTLEEKLQECAEAGEKARDLYARRDELLAEIALEVTPGDILTATDGSRFLLVDNFAKAKKNKKYPNPTIWAHAGARRWELEPVKP